jgi:RNA-directed DNA polymerase
MLANIYMNRFLKHWRLTGCQEAFRAHVVSMPMTSSSSVAGTRPRRWRGPVMTKLGLTLNEAKTSLKEARTESFAFLGYCVLQRHLERRATQERTRCREAA